jgi:hypothetical protein
MALDDVGQEMIFEDDVDVDGNAPRPDRHPATQELLSFFDYGHLPAHLQVVSRACQHLAVEMVDALPDGPQLTTGLRKLLEAKDCFVRQAVKVARESQTSSA